MTTTYKIDKFKVQQAIKTAKWDRYTYEYAMNNMVPWSSGHWSGYKKTELIDLFYNKIETKFHLIEKFTAFRNNNFYL